MKSFTGKTLRWEWRDGVIELTLDREPANEIGTAMLAELEKFVARNSRARARHRRLHHHQRSQSRLLRRRRPARTLRTRLRTNLGSRARRKNARIPRSAFTPSLNAIDEAPFVTIAAVHGVCFGGGLELALACDIIVADKMARFAFPELRLGFIPGFGGIPRLKRDLGNGFVRDLLLTGRSVNATRAQAVGLVAQLASEGEALRAARATAAQITKFNPATRAIAKKFIKPIPREELRQEIDLFCELFIRPGSHRRPEEIRRVKRRDAISAVIVIRSPRINRK